MPIDLGDGHTLFWLHSPVKKVNAQKGGAVGMSENRPVPRYGPKIQPLPTGKI